MYNVQNVRDFIDRIANGSSHCDVIHPHNCWSFAEKIACLANHDMDKLWTSNDISIASGRQNVVDGASTWLNALSGVGFVYPTALENIRPSEYWCNFWWDVRRDAAEATYERLYIGVLYLLKVPSSLSLVTYVRAIMDILVFDNEEPLTNEQGLVVGRIIQLIALIDRDDPGKSRLKEDIINALPCMIKPCENSYLVYLEYVAAYKRHVEADELPREISKHLKLRHATWSSEVGGTQVTQITIGGEEMIVVVYDHHHKHIVIPRDVLCFVFEPRYLTASGRWSSVGNMAQIYARGFWEDGEICGQTMDDAEQFKQRIWASFPYVPIGERAS